MKQFYLVDLRTVADEDNIIGLWGEGTKNDDVCYVVYPGHDLL
jgi:hypothetical protein